MKTPIEIKRTQGDYVNNDTGAYVKQVQRNEKPGWMLDMQESAIRMLKYWEDQKSRAEFMEDADGWRFADKIAKEYELELEKIKQFEKEV